MSYLHKLAVAGEFASSPDHARLDITGDLDLRWFGASQNWDGNEGVLIGKDESGKRAFIFNQLAANAKFILYWFEATVLRSETSAIHTFVDGVPNHVRVTLDVDNGAGQYEVKFYTGGTATEPVWVQHGSTITGSTGTSSIDSTAAVLEIGSNFAGTANVFAGEICGAQVYDGIDGTLVFDADFTNLTQAEVEAASFAEDANAAVVTLNGDAWTYVNPVTNGILGRAELLFMASDRYAKGSPKWADLSGNNHHAQHGSAAGADVNDPRGFVGSDFVGTQSLHLPGIAANYASTPDAAPLQITGDIFVQAKVALSDWSEAGNQVICARFNIGLTSWIFRILGTSSELAAHVVDSGGTGRSYAGTAPTVSDGAVLWIGFTVDVDNGAAGHDVKFWVGGTGDTPIWVQQGSTVTTAGVIAIRAGNEDLEIGTRGGGATNPMLGEVHRIRIYSDLTETTLVFDADFTDAAALVEPFATFVEESSNAATMTINRAATGRKAIVVNGPRFLRGTDDMFEIPDDAALDFATGDDFSLMTISRSYDVTPAADQVLIAKKANLTTAVGYALYIDTTGVPNFVLDDGTAAPDTASGPALTDGQEHVITVVRDAAGDNDIIVYTDGVAGTPVTDGSSLTLANAEVLRLGRLSGAGTSYVDDEIVGAAVWSEALTAADVLLAQGELGLVPRSGKAWSTAGSESRSG